VRAQKDVQSPSASNDKSHKMEADATIKASCTAWIRYGNSFFNAPRVHYLRMGFKSVGERSRIY
jgi:hypothetical protein